MFRVESEGRSATQFSRYALERQSSTSNILIKLAPIVYHLLPTLSNAVIRSDIPPDYQ